MTLSAEDRALMQELTPLPRGTPQPAPSMSPTDRALMSDLSEPPRARDNTPAPGFFSDYVLRQGIGQGMLMGTGDEALARIRAFATGRSYDDLLEEERVRNERSSGVGGTVAQIAGGVLPAVGLALATPITGGAAAPAALGAGARLAVTASRLFNAVPNAAARAAGGGAVRQGAAAGVAGGAVAGAAQGFGAGEGGFANRAEDAVSGGILGAGLGGVLGAGIGAVRPVISGAFTNAPTRAMIENSERLERTTIPVTQADGSVVQTPAAIAALQDSETAWRGLNDRRIPGSPELPRQPLSVGEATPDTLADLDALATSPPRNVSGGLFNPQNGQPSQFSRPEDVVREISRRVSGSQPGDRDVVPAPSQSERVQQYVSAAFGVRPQSLSDISRSNAELKAQEGELYNTVRANGEVLPPNPRTTRIVGALDNDVLRDAESFARTRALRNDETPPPALFDSDGNITRDLTATELLSVRSALNGKADEAWRANNGDRGRNYSDQRDILTEHMDEIIPGYREARASYADQSAIARASDFGRTIFDRKIDAAEITSRTSGMSESERAAFGVAAISRINSDIANTADNAGTRVARNEEMRERIRAVMGGIGRTQEDADNLLRVLQDEQTIGRTTQRVVAATPTASRANNAEQRRQLDSPMQASGRNAYLGAAAPLAILDPAIGALSAVAGGNSWVRGLRDGRAQTLDAGRLSLLAQRSPEKAMEDYSRGLAARLTRDDRTRRAGTVGQGTGILAGETGDMIDPNAPTRQMITPDFGGRGILGR